MIKKIIFKKKKFFLKMSVKQFYNEKKILFEMFTCFSSYMCHVNWF